MMEQTLIILKPDCMAKRLAGKVISRFEEAGFSIAEAKLDRLTEPLLREHYAHVAHLPFFPEIVAFMMECPVLILILEGDDVVKKVRELLGPTDSTAAPPDTLRGEFGTDKMRNIAHASDSPATAAAEIERFFPELVAG